MGVKRNAILSVAAAGLLIVGLLVLIPEPVHAVKPQAPTVALADTNGAAAGSPFTTQLTLTVIIPAGEFIPISTAEVLAFKGTPTSVVSGEVTATTGGALAGCTGVTIKSVSGDDYTFGRYLGYGYSAITQNGYGYGYDFSGSQTEFNFDGYDAGYVSSHGHGYGYGYGDASKTVALSVVVEVTNCPAVTDFPASPAFLETFTFQVRVGTPNSAGGRMFASLPSTVRLANPEIAPSTTTTAGNGGGVSTTVTDGATTTFSYSFNDDGDGIRENFAAGTVFALPVPPGADLDIGTITLTTGTTPLPEGATLSFTIQGPGSSGCGIDAADLSSIQGNGNNALGFICVNLSGLLTGTATTAMDITFTVRLGSSTLVMRHFDASGNLAAPHPSCTGPVAPDFTFTCTLTAFSSFAMVSSVAGGGGGGGSGGGATGTTTGTGTSTSTATATGSVSSSVSGSVTPTGTGSDSQSSTGDKRGGSAPGLEFGLLIAALAGIALLARRQLK